MTFVAFKLKLTFFTFIRNTKEGVLTKRNNAPIVMIKYSGGILRLTTKKSVHREW